MKNKLRALMFRVWYWYISKADKNAEVLFMNFGYADSNDKIPLDEKDEPNRYCIQIYHRLASKIELKNKSILEIGCGRGGGLAYIIKTFSPSEALGIDLNKKAVKFSNQYYKHIGLSFMQGNALSLPIPDDSFDFVLNVESSHRYLDFNQFLNEVNRVLKPGGYFLFTDFRRKHEMDTLEKNLEALNYKLIEKQNINQNVAMALKNDSERRINLVKKLSPKFIHNTAINFSGAEGSDTYERFLHGDWLYFMYILQKN